MMRPPPALGVGIAIAVGAAVGIVAGYGIHRAHSVPSPRQGLERVREIRRLEPLRSGRIRTHVVTVDDDPQPDPRSAPDTIRYSLQAPGWPVEDAEIRGLLGADPKYPFNQGTAYHMRMGRRFAGPSEGLYELKRGLVRWQLPRLPEGSRILSAAVSFWVESHDLKSPLAKHPVPLHLYAYPVMGRWAEGRGGVNRDNFSPASRGEVTWKDARSGVEPWPSPGGLGREGGRYSVDPLAMAVIPDDDAPVVLESPALAAHVAECAERGSSFDLLMKLDDVEEDRPGTEVSLLSSNFGDPRDGRPKRPRLDLVVVVPHRGGGQTEWFTIEPGQSHWLAPVMHRGRTVIVAAELVEGDGGLPPGLFVRGGQGDPNPDSVWTPLAAPVERRWDWSQVSVRSPATHLVIGDSLTIRLHEFWVRPGPRQRQRPELALISPSGELKRVLGVPGEGDEYRIPFLPEEPGLWRYGWSFRPHANLPPESHRGEGVFFVRLPEPGEAEGMTRVKRWAAGLRESLRTRRISERSAQVRVNALYRWAGAYAGRAAARDRAEVERLVREARKALPRDGATSQDVIPLLLKIVWFPA